MPMKPVNGLDVLLICAPRKVLKEVDFRGKRKMSGEGVCISSVVTVPTSFCGIGKIVAEDSFHTDCTGCGGE